MPSIFATGRSKLLNGTVDIALDGSAGVDYPVLVTNRAPSSVSASVGYNTFLLPNKLTISAYRSDGGLGNTDGSIVDWAIIKP